MSNESPSAEVLEERIVALDKRIDDRFIALDKALKLAAGEHKVVVSMWLSIAALLIAAGVGAGTIVVMLVRHA